MKGLSTKERLLARKKSLESKGSGEGLVYPKEGSTRIRIKSPGEDAELGLEVIRFYLGQDKGSIISPATFDEPCPFMEKYEELKNSKDDADKELAKLLVPSRRFVIGGIVYEDEKGSKVGYDGKDKGILITNSIYQGIIDLYLDEDEAGDMTDPKNGYDIKIIRSGSGKFDTTYSVRACKPTKLDKKYQKDVDLEGIVRKQVKSYGELEDLLNEYLNTSPSSDDEDEDDKPKKKKSSVDKAKKKKKHKVSDI